MTSNLSLLTVDAILILDGDGNRILASYFSPPHDIPDEKSSSGSNEFATVKDQRTFEKGLFQKVHKQNTDIILFNNKIVVYKEIVDVGIFIVGGAEENETLLYQLLLGIRDALDILLKHSIDKRTVLENYDLVSLAVDESVDDGIILEVDGSAIASRVSRSSTEDDVAGYGLDLSERGMKSYYRMARDLSEKIRQGL